MWRWEESCRALEDKGFDAAERYREYPENHPELKAPDMPEGLTFRDLWFDLSPMRPDEFRQQSAARWELAEQIRSAYEKGRRLERSFREHAMKVQADDKQRIAALKARMGG